MFYICVICDCVCVLKYAIYLIWPRQFSFGPDSSHLAHVFLIWLIPWPEQKMSQRGPCQYLVTISQNVLILASSSSQKFELVSFKIIFLEIFTSRRNIHRSKCCIFKVFQCAFSAAHLGWLFILFERVVWKFHYGCLDITA